MWMKANQMPSVENQFCDTYCKKGSPGIELFATRSKKPRRAGRAFCGLMAFS
jgi:hypothetical protein